MLATGMAENRDDPLRPPTVAELRARIGAKASGDKVPGVDPAAAPLGTSAGGDRGDPCDLRHLLDARLRRATGWGNMASPPDRRAGRDSS